MTDPTAPRRFDDDEVALIIRRATELQEARRTDAPEQGLTLADLEAVAREAGLDPALVRRAAGELPARELRASRGLAARLFGAPTTLRYERLVDGELRPADVDVVIDDVRRTLKDVGVTSAVGRTLAWSSSAAAHPGRTSGRASGRAVSVTVATRGGRTAIRVEESARGLAGGVFGGIVGGVGGSGAGLATGIGIGVMHAPVIALGLWAATLAGSYSLARLVFLGAVRRRADELSALADRIASTIESGAPGR